MCVCVCVCVRESVSVSLRYSMCSRNNIRVVVMRIKVTVMRTMYT